MLQGVVDFLQSSYLVKRVLRVQLLLKLLRERRMLLLRGRVVVVTLVLNYQIPLIHQEQSLLVIKQC